MRALRFFYGVTLGHAEVPERVVYDRSPRSLPTVLSVDEVIRFLEAVPSVKTRTALTTACAGCLRASEIVGLKVGDIDSEWGIIRVEQGKDRSVVLSAKLLLILRVYWKLASRRDAGSWTRRQSSHRLAGALFGLPLGAGHRRHRQADDGPHAQAQLRPHLLENGTDIRIIQVLLGHNNLSSPARYTKISNGLSRRTTSRLLKIEVMLPRLTGAAMSARLEVADTSAAMARRIDRSISAISDASSGAP